MKLLLENVNVKIGTFNSLSDFRGQRCKKRKRRKKFSEKSFQADIQSKEVRSKKQRHTQSENHNKKKEKNYIYACLNIKKKEEKFQSKSKEKGNRKLNQKIAQKQKD